MIHEAFISPSDFLQGLIDHYNSDIDETQKRMIIYNFQIWTQCNPASFHSVCFI